MGVNQVNGRDITKGTMKKRTAELQERAREGVADLIQSDLDGHSENLKEVWEETFDSGEQEVVTAELKRIVHFLYGEKP